MGDLAIGRPGRGPATPYSGGLARPTDLDLNLRIYLALKGAVDVVGCLCGIALCLPLWALIALAIKLDSPGPVIFRQRRPGQFGHMFEILKFRTMRSDAEKDLEKILAINPERDGSLIRVENDYRVTRVGRVLRGEMSLVGPRPISRPIPDPRGLQRLAARPGITGLWQVNGRKDTDCQFMLRKDMEYLERRCLSLDFSIMARTFGVLFRPKGAR